MKHLRFLAGVVLVACLIVTGINRGLQFCSDHGRELMRVSYWVKG
jgi:hypothetical protein